MHTLHWWAVEAEDKEDAANVVEAALENNYVEWSDWQVVIVTGKQIGRAHV